MNSKVIIAIVVLLIVFVGGYMLMKQKAVAPAPEPENPESATEEVATEDGVFTGSLESLVLRGGSYTCEITHATTDGAVALSQSTVYVDGGRMRTDYTTVIEGQGEIKGSMISDSDWVYTWSSAAPQGMKLKAMTADTSAGTAPNAAWNMNGMDAEYVWDCDPWTADESVFTPPSTVTFMELPAGMMQGAQ